MRFRLKIFCFVLFKISIVIINIFFGSIFTLDHNSVTFNCLDVDKILGKYTYRKLSQKITTITF